MLKNSKKQKIKESINQIRSKNQWKNPIRFFKNEIKTKNTKEVELTCLTKFKNKFFSYVSHKNKNQELWNKDCVIYKKNLSKSFIRATKFSNVLEHFFKEGGNIRNLCKQYRISKSLFYSFYHKYNIWKNSRFYSLEKFVTNSTKPFSLQYKYSNHQRKTVCDKYFNYTYSGFKVQASIMQVVNELKFEYKTKEFKNLSYSTAHKFIKNDERYINYRKYDYKIEHKRRKRYIPAGNFQFDLKIIGRKETHFNTPIVIASLKDESSKMVYGRYIPFATAEKAIDVLKNGYEYFEELGLKIKRIRTDNAMMFYQKQNKASNYKKINFINENLFYQFLREKNIKHERIPIGQSESNGTIERYHRTIDMELLKVINSCKSLDQVDKVIKDFVDWYNFQRYHTNSIYESDARISKYIKPIDFLNKLLYLESTKQLY